MTGAYQEALSSVGAATLNVLTALEMAMRRLHPPEIPELRTRVMPYRDKLAAALGEFRAAEPPDRFEGIHQRFLEGASRALEAASLFVDEAPRDRAIARVLGSLREFCRSLEVFYTLHRLPPLSRYFVEPAFHDKIEELDPEPPEDISIGLHQTGCDGTGGDGGAADRGGFAFYVPESYDGSADWPLVVALHGGSGNGRDFVWMWLREARGRRFMLLAPTARGSTWALEGPDVDADSLRTTVEYAANNWRIDRSRILLTGLSDGATYATLSGLREDSPFTALAPVSGVVHPASLVGDNLERIKGKRIYMVHGALDWMFPIEVARVGHEQLLEAGADVTFREIKDLSHTYPREENDRILTWFDPSLALPAAPEDTAAD